MDFKQFLTMVNEAESTAEKDDKAEKAGKKVTTDIEYDDKKDRKEKKKSLKDWFEAIDKKTLLEDQTQLVPNKFYVVGSKYGRTKAVAGPFDDDGEAEIEKAEYSEGGRYDAAVAQWTGKDWNFDYMMEQGVAEGNAAFGDRGKPGLHRNVSLDTLDPRYAAMSRFTPADRIKRRLGHDERGDARVRAGQERSTHLRNKPHLPEQGVAEGYGASLSDILDYLRDTKPNMDRDSFLDDMYMYVDATYGKPAADRLFQDESNYDKWYNAYLGKQGVAEGQAPTYNVIDVKTGKSVGTFRDGAGFMPGANAKAMGLKPSPTVPNGYKVDYKSIVSEQGVAEGQAPEIDELATNQYAQQIIKALRNEYGPYFDHRYNRDGSIQIWSKSKNINPNSVITPWYKEFRSKGWRFDQPVNGEFTIAVNKQQGVAEAEQLTIEPAKQSTQVIKKGNDVIGSVTNPALAATIKSAIGKGEMSLAGDDLKEEQPMMEKAPPGMEDVVLSLKKEFPGEEGRAYKIAWSMYNKKHGKNEAAEDNPDSAMLDEKWAGDAKVKPTGQYKDKTVEELKSMLAKLKKSGPHKADSPEAKKQHQINFALRAKGGWKKGEGAAMKEAEIPNQGSDYGAGLGAGRNPKVLESKQVNEAMNTLEAAYHEGKSHGLSKHSYACRYNEGTEEHKRYHEGFKEGLDECYGLMPNRGLVVSEIESGQDVVDDMASYGAEEGSLGEMDKTAYMQHKAKTTPGDTFKAFGQTFKDKEVLEMDSFAFESLDKQLNDLLNEGLSVNMSQGLDGPGGQMEDTVSVTAQGDDAGKLLQFIKQVGLGGLGADKPLDGPAEPAVAVVSDYGAPKFGGYDNEPKSMMDLMKVMSGGEDYKDEEGHDHGHDHHEEKCDECGTMMTAEGGCGCDEAKEVVDEVETPDQLEYQVAEDDGEGYEQGQEAAAQIDSALAASGADKGGATNEDGMESNPLAADAVASADAAEEEQEAMSESSFLNLYKKIALISEESTKKEDEKAEKAGEKVTKDIEYDDKKDKKDKKEKVDEWANDAGKDGTQQTFERDIEFMTKVIAGGLNKPKATGQTTIPVIASQDARNGSDEDVSAWKRLAGLGK